jgi:site-specific DNA-cytosine methylase
MSNYRVYRKSDVDTLFADFLDENIHETISNYVEPHNEYTVLELFAGAGGLAVGMEKAGLKCVALNEIDKWACSTLRKNRPNWNVIEGDVRDFSAKEFKGVDLLAGGVPCPPFSKAGKQLGSDDERDLFPEALRLVDECRPKAVMLENVRGFLDAVFSDYRMSLRKELKSLGYDANWHLLNASDFGVPQLRPRVVVVAIRNDLAKDFLPLILHSRRSCGGFFTSPARCGTMFTPSCVLSVGVATPAAASTRTRSAPPTWPLPPVLTASPPICARIDGTFLTPTSTISRPFCAIRTAR